MLQNIKSKTSSYWSPLQGLGVWFYQSSYNSLARASKNEVGELFSSYFDLDEARENKVKFMQQQDPEAIDPAEREDYKLYKFALAVRNLALLGFFTSEKIGKEVLNFDPIPGGFQPCIPLSEVGNAWTI